PGLCLRWSFHKTSAISAMPMGMPGWPELAFCTASIARARMALASCRREDVCIGKYLGKCVKKAGSDAWNERGGRPRILDYGARPGNADRGPAVSRALLRRSAGRLGMSLVAGT